MKKKKRTHERAVSSKEAASENAVPTISGPPLKRPVKTDKGLNPGGQQDVED